MTPETRKRLAKEFGRYAIRHRAKLGLSIQALHDKMKRLGYQKPPHTRNMQKHEAGDMVPSKTKIAMYEEAFGSPFKATS